MAKHARDRFGRYTIGQQRRRERSPTGMAGAVVESCAIVQLSEPMLQAVGCQVLLKETIFELADLTAECEAGSTVRKQQRQAGCHATEGVRFAKTNSIRDSKAYVSLERGFEALARKISRARGTPFRNFSA